MSTSTSAFRLNDTGNKIWTLTFDLPGEKVNKLSQKVMEEATTMMGELEKRANEIEALVLVSGKKGNFIAGADIEMIRTTDNAEKLSSDGQKLFNRWEDLPFPTIAAIDGAALGGGCEFALASTAIVMSNDSAARIGLPEVMLGLIPGAGGCVRMPRKVGIATALDMILTGKTLTGERAYRSGLIEAWLPKEDFQGNALHWVKTNLEALKAGKRLAKEPKLGGMGGTMGSLMEHTPMGRAVIYKKAREGVLAKSRGHYPAPVEAISVLQDNGAAYGPKLRGVAREQALMREAKGFGEMAKTEVSKNLIRIFFLTESVKKSNGLPPGVSAKPHPVHVGGVLGAGVMGGGIAQLLAAKDLPSRMKDVNNKALTAGIQQASRIFQKEVQKKKLTRRQYLQKLNLIAPVTDYSGFRSADVVIEAIIENLEIKQKVLRELEDFVREGAIIATNTSSLSVSKMQAAMKNPARFAGMHFFNPVAKMPLIEVIRGDQSSDEAVATLFDLAKRLGKTPIVVKDAPGFLVNRLLMPYLNEASYLVAEGISIPELDKVLLDFGMPMGPMTLIDEVGIDVGAKVAHILHEAFGERAAPSPINDKLVAKNHLGKKNGKGLYNYDPSGRNQTFDPSIYEILEVTPTPGAVSEEEIIDRCLLPMINEASRCLEEKIVFSPSEVDIGMIMGTGFPPFRGGLLRYADSLGSRAILEKLRKYHSRFGARFEPAPAIVKMAEHGQSFYK